MEINMTEELYQSLSNLRQNAQMFRMMLFGLETCLDELPLQCLFRMSDYLDQRVDEVCALCGYPKRGF